MAKEAVPVGVELVGLLARATADDLATLDKLIAEKEAAIEAAVVALKVDLSNLQLARKWLDEKLTPKPPRKAWSRKAKPDGGTAAAPAPISKTATTSSTEERRLAVVRLLAKDGCLPPIQIANRCDIPTGSITFTLDHECFEKTTSGVRLTVAGRRAAAEGKL